MYLGTLCFKDIGSRKVEFVAKTQILRSTYSMLENVFFWFFKKYVILDSVVNRQVSTRLATGL